MSTTVDPDGNVVTTTIEDRKAFVTVERSVCPQPYETAKASCMVQVDLNGDASTDDDAIKGAFALAKVAVLSQLGLSYEVNAELIVVEIENLERKLGATVVEGEKPKTPTARKAAPKGRKAKGPEQEAWADLEANPDGWFDNRADKRNPKAPDFKKKNNNRTYNGPTDALWLDSAPDGFVEPPM